MTSPSHFAFEVSVLTDKHLTGVGYYAGNLLSTFIRANPGSTFDLIWFRGENTPQSLLSLPNTRGIQVPLPRKLYKLLLLLHLAPRLDVMTGSSSKSFLFPAFTGWPLSRGKRSTLIVYDTAFIDHPALLKTARQRFYMRRSLAGSIIRADRVIAISESTKQSVMRHFGTTANKLTVITPALDHAKFKPATPAAIEGIKAKLGIAREYVLYLGTLEPRKNVVGIIRAYESLPPELKRRYQLVPAGGKGWGSVEIESAAQAIPKENLVRTGYIADGDMAPLYSGASLFLFPSIFEGWGMPITEAQSCGTPVLAADNSSLPEAGGAAAVYAKTGDQPDLNQKLRELLDNSSQREQMRISGLAHAAKFTWENSARQLQSVFEQVGS